MMNGFDDFDVTVTMEEYYNENSMIMGIPVDADCEKF